MNDVTVFMLRKVVGSAIPSRFMASTGEPVRNGVLHNLTPAAMLTLWLCWSALAGSLFAEEQLQVPALIQSQEVQPTGQLA